MATWFLFYHKCCCSTMQCSEFALCTNYWKWYETVQDSTRLPMNQSAFHFLMVERDQAIIISLKPSSLRLLINSQLWILRQWKIITIQKTCLCFRKTEDKLKLLILPTFIDKNITINKHNFLRYPHSIENHLTCALD